MSLPLTRDRLAALLRMRLRLPGWPADANEAAATTQWVLSFMALDMAFLLLVVGSCLVSFSLCGVGFYFMLAAYYTPFVHLAGLMQRATGLDTSAVIILLLALLLHAAMGLGAAAVMCRKRRLSWFMSICLATIINLSAFIAYLKLTSPLDLGF